MILLHTIRTAGNRPVGRSLFDFILTCRLIGDHVGSPTKMCPSREMTAKDSGHALRHFHATGGDPAVVGSSKVELAAGISLQGR